MNLKNKIESILFVSGAPIDALKIAKLLNIKKEDALNAIEELSDDYKNNERGIQIAKVADKFQVVTSAQNAEEVGMFLRQEIIGELTKPQLETLTIIAYRCPIVKPELEQIRGVNCTIILRNLMIRGLIEESELKDGMDTYIVTHDFLKFLGIVDVKELPDYEKLNANKNLNELLNSSEEK